MKEYIHIILLMIILTGCSAANNNSLPAAAEQAFDNWVQNDFIREDIPHIDYTITSTSKATGNFRGDEVWCIVTDVEIPLFMDSRNHFFLTREQSYWDVTYAVNQREFLQVGCENW